MEEVYKLKLDLNYQNIIKIKEKDAYILIQTIINSQLGINHIKFNSYGVIEFDDSDKQKNSPTVTTFDKFNRLKVNCIVFDLIYNVQNDEFFDKLFVYVDAATDEYYNYIMYNTQTHKMIHKYLLEKQVDILIQSFKKDFFALFNTDIYKFYLQKAFAIKDLQKNKNNSTVHIPNIKDYKKMIEQHNAKYDKYMPKEVA